VMMIELLGQVHSRRRSLVAQTAPLGPSGER
jgi:hypothetical protein